MRLVADTNILFTYFWKDSFTKKNFVKENLDLFSPEFALEEIKFYTNEIMQKTNISKEEFNKLREELAIIVKFIPVEEYSKFLKEALKLSVDENDVDFIALALKLNCPIWSKDYHLKQQNKIRVFTTKELIMIL